TISRKKLAEKLGVSRQTIISILKRKYDPSLPLAFEIAKTFQTTIEHVFIYEGKEGEE
ncbi:transcriptional regulator, partial [Bacillus cereus]